jgi:hypothetical protein
MGLRLAYLASQASLDASLTRNPHSKSLYNSNPFWLFLFLSFTNIHSCFPLFEAPICSILHHLFYTALLIQSLLIFGLQSLFLSNPNISTIISFTLAHCCRAMDFVCGLDIELSLSAGA